MKLEKRNILFDPVEHKYTDENNNRYISVTQLLGTLEPVFDVEYWSMYKALERSKYEVRPDVKNRNFKVKIRNNWCDYSLFALNEGVLGLSVSVDDIRKEWKQINEESCIFGNEKHNFLEECVESVYQTKKVRVEDIVTHSRDFKLSIRTIAELEQSSLSYLPGEIYNKLEVYIKNGWVLYPEKRIYSSYHLLAGTVDLPMIKNKQVVIIDWKTNKDKLEFRSGYYKKVWNEEKGKKIKTKEFVVNNERFNNPLNHIPHSKGNGYQLQVSTYAYLFDLWGYKPVGLVLCHIRPEMDEYGEIVIENDKRKEMPPEFYPLTYQKTDIEKLFNWRYNQIKNEQKRKEQYI